MLPIGKPLMLLGAVIGALLLVQTISAPYREQLDEARATAALQAAQAEAAAQATDQATKRAEQAQRKKEDATHAATQQSDFDDPAPNSLVAFLRRLLGDG